jgi:A/G-specific adenine glycosylase
VHAVPTSASIRSVRQRIQAWYAAEQRDLPFRRSRDPWPVLVAEVMLQQTQASRIAERFDDLLARYPSPEAMAHATPAQVLTDWSGLGYNRRALGLHAAATRIAADGWPESVAGLEQLPGIGTYSARAIASIAWDQPVGAVDTNVRRWLVRRFAADPADHRALQAMADRLATAATTGSAGEAGTWTHATMEFGARICTARSPRCAACPVSRGCPSRTAPPHVPVPRQPASTAEVRAARGRLLRALTEAPGHRLGTLKARAALTEGTSGLDYRLLTTALERDGLIHRAGSSVVLGPAAAQPDRGG